MTENKFVTFGKRINRNGKLLNINFETKSDALLCCKLLNQQDREYDNVAEKLDDVFKWHKEHYGKTILDEKLEFKSNCEKEVMRLKNTLTYRDEQLAFAEYLINDFGSEEMNKKWEEFNND